jgi:hypothetical protein
MQYQEPPTTQLIVSTFSTRMLSFFYILQGATRKGVVALAEKQKQQTTATTTRPTIIDGDSNEQGIFEFKA